MDRRATSLDARCATRIAITALLCVVVATQAAAQGTPYLVRDIEQRPDTGAVAVRDMGAVGVRVFFAGNDGVHGFELWTSDGTSDGTRLVEDIQPGPRGAVATDFTAVGDAVYFVVDDGVHGRELWTSDGTEDGTYLVRDLAPGRAESLPHLLTPLGDLLFFVADDGTHGDELWVTDGSEGGTALVADVRGGAGGARIKEMVAAGGLVWLVANDGVHGSELWSSDGTPEGTQLVGDLRPGSDGSLPADLVAFEDGVLFSATDGATGREPWRADATAGARRVADLSPGRPGSNPSGLVVAGALVYFTATISDVEGARLWATDGTEDGTFRVSDVAGENGDLALWHTAAIGDTLYFVTATDDGRGGALWRSDGTEAGTRLVKDLKSYPCSDEFRAMAVLGDRLMLVARSSDSDDELWISDGTEAGTQRVRDIFPGRPGGRPGSLTVAGDVLFFAAVDGLHGRELWRSDGTEAGTALVRDILDGNGSGVQSYPSLIAQGDQVYFPAFDGAMWQSDGTFAGTTRIVGPAGRTVTNVLDARGTALFLTTDGPPQQGYRLWRTEGGGFSALADIASSSYPNFSLASALGGDVVYGLISRGAGAGTLWRTVAGTTTPTLLRSYSSSWPSGGLRAGDHLYFTAGDPQTGSELWRTDGTPQGTTIVADLNPGPAGSSYNGGTMAKLGRRVLFAADDGTHGREIHVTDGTPGGTQLLRDIYPGPGGSGTFGVARLGDAIYFGASSPTGSELWRSDGTDAGTERVAVVAPPPALGGDAPIAFARLGDVLLFAVTRPETGTELWRSDGTAAGTELLVDALPGPGSSNPSPIVVVGDMAYFPVYTASLAVQLWITDGTPAGTRLAVDVSGGAPGAGVRTAENRNGQLFFVANDGVHGNELWALTCGNGVLDEYEACDDGQQNGSPVGCCTGACTLRPGAGDACDPIEGGLTVARARVQYDAPGGGTTGRIAVDGFLDADAALPLAIDAGLVASIDDGAGFSRRLEWSAAECAVRSNGVLRCARRGAVATFRPVAGAAAGAQRLRFALTASGLDVTGPLAPALTVKLTTGDRLDRAGGIDDCVARRRAVVCSP
ncbi:hypothetical protein K2Z84_23430 [Candidatus Binatia bacterium]|nr:hypothetical protein [Candidatus Binatia bacterium]